MNTNTITRGARNRNPLNIRYNPANNWRGQLGQDSRGYCVFASMQYGIEAAARLLYVYHNRYNLTTIPLIISRWAPASENDVEAYIKTVCRITKFPRDKQLEFTAADFGPLLCAMARVESQLHLDAVAVDIALNKAIH